MKLQLAFRHPLQAVAALLLTYSAGKKRGKMSFVSPGELGRRELVIYVFILDVDHFYSLY